MPESLGRAESEGGKCGHGAALRWRMAKFSGEAWAPSWVGHLDPLQNDGLGGGGWGWGGTENVWVLLVSLTSEQGAWALGLR